MFAGGVVGAVLRAEVAEALPRGAGAWPWATFAVNVSGAFLLGLLVMLARRRDEPQYPPRDPKGAHSAASETSSLHRPSSLLQTVGAATAVLLDPRGEKARRNSLGGGGPVAGGEGDGAGTNSFDAAALSYGGSDYEDEPSTADRESPGRLPAVLLADLRECREDVFGQSPDHIGRVLGVEPPLEAVDRDPIRAHAVTCAPGSSSSSASEPRIARRA